MQRNESLLDWEPSDLKDVVGESSILLIIVIVLIA